VDQPPTVEVVVTSRDGEESEHDDTDREPCKPPWRAFADHDAPWLPVV
jgi:hypothetical protein